MINTIYRLVSPKQFEVTYQEVDLNERQVMVRPTHLSICKADQRYYLGDRDPEILNEKLPMALIHEGIGEVVYDPTGNFQVGDLVVLIPNIPQEEDDFISENYLDSSQFRSSGFDGYLQEYVATSPDRIVKLPSSLNPEVAAFTELISVCLHSICRLEKVSHPHGKVVGVWGDGNVGFITSLLLKTIYPHKKVIVFGKNLERMSYFTFADQVYTINQIPPGLTIDEAFECVGGIKSQSAIEQIIEHLSPEGVISLLGVSEYHIPINTRLILEKGLFLYGSSRSGRVDFKRVLDIFQKHPLILSYLEELVIEKVRIRKIEDIKEAFERDVSADLGKVILIWDK